MTLSLKTKFSIIWAAGLNNPNMTQVLPKDIIQPKWESTSHKHISNHTHSCSFSRGQRVHGSLLLHTLLLNQVLLRSSKAASNMRHIRKMITDSHTRLIVLSLIFQEKRTQQKNVMILFSFFKKIFTWLYFARRSDLQGAPVLIWPCNLSRIK